MPPPAVQLIVEDHQALAAVLRALRGSAERAGQCGEAPDFGELRAMLYYLDEMPSRVHHASESELLFPRIRERCPALRPVLDRLEAEHERGESSVRELEQALTAWEVMGEPRRGAFQRLLQAHADVYLGHMEVEESYVLPVAIDYLSPADWRDLADALSSQRNEHIDFISQSQRALIQRIAANPWTTK